jgi:hypothetical protein
VLIRISGPTLQEVTGCWGKLHNEELHNLDSSSNVIEGDIKKNYMGGDCGMRGRNEKCIKKSGCKTLWEESILKA